MSIRIDLLSPGNRRRSSLFVSMTTRRRKARVPKQEQRKESTPPTASKGPPSRLPAHLDFFVVPLEIRNMVYNVLWKSKNRVAARHGPSLTGILAYYDGMVLDETGLITEEAIQAEDKKKWRPGPFSGLPKWLLTNKQILEEGMTQFRRKANWNIWSLRPRGSTPPRTPEAELVDFKFATSISLPRMLLKAGGWNRSYLEQSKHETACSLSGDDAEWLDDMTQTLGDSPDVKKLQLSLGCPYVLYGWSLREHERHPSEIRWQINENYGELIRACEALETLETETFHWEYQNATEVLDTEVFPSIWLEFKAAMGGDVSETTTTTMSPVFGGYLENHYVSTELLEWKVVFTKKTGK
jgi:hypothetical protein